MSIMEHFARWLLECPQLSGHRLNVNYLGVETPEWALIEAPVTPVLTRYADGTTLKQKGIALTSVEDRTPDVLMQLAATGVWEDITAWVVAQNNRRRNLPALGDGITCRSVEVTSTHSILSSTAQTARFQLQFVLTYEQKG